MRSPAQSLTAAILLSVAAFAPAAADTTRPDLTSVQVRCQNFDDEILDRIALALARADKLLPNVPPEEDRYLAAEEKRALRVGNEALVNKASTDASNRIFHALQARPLYFPWSVRKDRELALKAILKITAPQTPSEHYWQTTYKGNREAQKLELASHAIYPLSRYAVSMHELLLREGFGQISVFSSDEHLSIYNDLLLLNGDLANFISCKLAKVMGPQ